MDDFIEKRIIEAVQKLLLVKVNDILSNMDFSIPLIEFGKYSGKEIITPHISLSTCERNEKERLIRQDAYSLIITFTLPDTPESELHCYAYSNAVGKAVYDDPTLGGVADRVVITGKKYVHPVKQHNLAGWELVISLRITVEEMKK